MLSTRYAALISDFTEELRAGFALDKKLSLHDVREVLRGRSEGLQALTIDQQGLKAFIGRLCDPYGDEPQWAISVATFLARKPPEKWGDDDLQTAQYRLREYISRLNDLRQLQLHYERGRHAGGKDLDAALVRLISTQGGEAEALVMLDASTKSFVAKHAEELAVSLSRLPTAEMRLATLVAVLKGLLRPTESVEDANSMNKVA